MKVSSDPDPRLTVLIVDDNRDAADSMAILAELWGHNPRVAYDAPAALRLVAQEPPDVILADLGMPRLDGNALARALRKEPAGNYVTLVAVTGHTDPGLREQALAAGFHHYLIKPVEPAALRELLAAKRQASRETLARAREAVNRAEEVTRRTAELLAQLRASHQSYTGQPRGE
ncbi:MAG TPA: response regulator [Gemmataceae bacterium]|nr:response regulator [Gemmataceae bacterium]